MARASFWTPARDAMLRKAWKTDAPSGEIAANIGCTKNAACGRADRLGLPPKPNVCLSNSRRAERFREKWARKGVATKMAMR